jgi:hypothetical protein
MSGEVDEIRVLVLEAGAVPPLVVLLGAGADAANPAAGALIVLAISDEGKQRIREAGAIPMLVVLLEATATAKSAALVLTNLSFHNDVNRDAITDASGITALVHVLKSTVSEADTCSASLGVLLNLSRHPPSQRAFMDANVLPAMAEAVQRHRTCSRLHASSIKLMLMFTRFNRDELLGNR